MARTLSRHGRSPYQPGYFRYSPSPSRDETPWVVRPGASSAPECRFLQTAKATMAANPVTVSFLDAFAAAKRASAASFAAKGLCAADRRGLAPTHVLLTHHHFDHVCEVGALRERWPELEVLISPLERELLAGAIKDEQAEPAGSATASFGTIEAGQTLQFGTLEVRPLLTPGQGTIDWPRTMQLLRSQGDNYPLLLELREVPDMGPPFDTLRKLFDTLENLTTHDES